MPESGLKNAQPAQRESFNAALASSSGCIRINLQSVFIRRHAAAGGEEVSRSEELRAVEESMRVCLP